MHQHSQDAHVLKNGQNSESNPSLTKYKLDFRQPVGGGISKAKNSTTTIQTQPQNRRVLKIIDPCLHVILTETNDCLLTSSQVCLHIYPGPRKCLKGRTTLGFKLDFTCEICEVGPK